MESVGQVIRKLIDRELAEPIGAVPGPGLSRATSLLPNPTSAGKNGVFRCRRLDRAIGCHP